MTIKELLEQLQSIDPKYHDTEVEVCNTATAKEYTISSVDDAPPFDVEEDSYEVIFINISGNY